MSNKIAALGICFLFLLFALSCQTRVTETPIAETTTIEEEDMIRFGVGQSLVGGYDSNLRVAAGDFFGDTCTLLFSLEDHSLPWMGGRYQVGEEIVYGKYVIKVLEMDYSGDSPWVRLGAHEIEEVGLEWPITMKPDGEGPYEIPTHTQLIYHDDNLLIGAGEFYSWKYDEKTGRYEDRADGPRVDTAGLWLVVRDGSEPAQYMRVHAGREAVYSKYQIQILEVRADRYRATEGLSRSDFTPSIRILISVVQETE